MTQAERSEDGTFTVDLRGLDLPGEAQDKIAHAIQKAVLAEIASLDLAEKPKIPRFDATLRLPDLVGPRGIAIRAIRES
ncbi:hypothetical protein [Amycolatopsis vastitatis]|nr:hypothetical protein [Amycolatopsis vastitatis]